MKTKEDLLKRVNELTEYFNLRGWHQHIDRSRYSCDAIKDLEKSDDMINFLIELVNIMKKYNISASGVNGHWCNFHTITENQDDETRFGVSNMWYLLKSQEEMDEEIEKGKKAQYERMLNNRVKFSLPEDLKLSKYPDEDEDDCKCLEPEEETECADEQEIESKDFNAEFTGDIETYVKVNHLETFISKDDKIKEICNKLVQVLNKYRFYNGQIEIKNPEEIINKIQLELIMDNSNSVDEKNEESYAVLVKNVLFKYIESYYEDSYDVTQYSLKNSINNSCIIVNIEDNISIKNIEITEPKWLLDEPINDGFFESDNEVDDRDDEDDEYEELCDYDAIGSFTADIELNIGKVESNDVDEDLINTCYEKVYDILESDGVSIDSDEDELFERIKIKELKDGTTLVTIDEVECSVRVDIQASCLDEANDERWSAFDNIICSLDYLKNIRNEHVSEAD